MQCNPSCLEKKNVEREKLWGRKFSQEEDFFLLKDVDGLGRSYELLCFQPWVNCWTRFFCDLWIRDDGWSNTRQTEATAASGSEELILNGRAAVASAGIIHCPKVPICPQMEKSSSRTNAKSKINKQFIKRGGCGENQPDSHFGLSLYFPLSCG